MASADKKGPHPLGLNPLGAYVWELMQARGVTSWSELAELLYSEAGYEVSVEELREWMYDEPDVLRVTEEESRRRLDS
jgi:hypothetical protein